METERSHDGPGAGVKELAIVGGLLVVLAAVVFGPHALDGGFLADDWAVYALLNFSDHQGFVGAIQTLLEQPNVSQRPGGAIYLATVETVFGMHMGFQLAWAAAMGVILVLSVYWVLRLMDLPALVAASVSLLILLFPGADSQRLWITASGGQLSVTFTVLGFGLAILAFRAKGRARIAIHAASLALFVASLLFQETALVVMGGGVLLYLLVAPWREALKRWAADLGVLVPIAVFVTSRSSFERQDGAGMVEHAKTMVGDAQALFTSVVLPVGVDKWFVLVPVLLVLGAAIAVARSLPTEDADRADLRRYLVAALAGLFVVMAGYAIYVPAADYYSPVRYGIGNRINGVPSIGWALLLVSIGMLAATLAARAIPRSRRYVQAIALCAVLLVAVQYIGQLRTDAGRYDRAFKNGAKALATMRAKVVPKPPSGAMIWTFAQPIEQVPGIPVFGNTWDMTSSVQLMWRDQTISSVPVYPDLKFDCQRGSVGPAGERFGKGRYRVPYGKAYFVDTATGVYAVPPNRAACLLIARQWGPSPAAAEYGGYGT